VQITDNIHGPEFPCSYGHRFKPHDLMVYDPVFVR